MYESLISICDNADPNANMGRRSLMIAMNPTLLSDILGQYPNKHTSNDTSRPYLLSRPVGEIKFMGHDLIVSDYLDYDEIVML